MKLCEPMDDEHDGQADRAPGRAVRDRSTSVNGWELDSVLERAMDALRCPDPDQSVKRALGR